MLRRFVGAVALATMFATGAHAQSPFQENFTFVGDQGFGGQAFNAYQGQFNLANANLGDGFAVLTPFQIWCVDENHFVSPGQTYDVWVTPLSTSDWSHVYKAAGAPGNYQESAGLGTEMTGPLGQSTSNDYIQYAIWNTMGYDYPPHNVSGYNFSDCQGGNVATCGTFVTADEGIALANLSNIKLNQWLVITVDNPNCIVSDPTSDTCRQEFLTLDTSRPQSTVPEPGTMGLLATGLVGMMGAGMRRRKNRK